VVKKGYCGCFEDGVGGVGRRLSISKLVLSSSSHVLMPYKSPVFLSVVVDFSAAWLSLKLALLHLLTHCIAARSCGVMLHKHRRQRCV
jgi:hypothetical protein